LKKNIDNIVDEYLENKPNLFLVDISIDSSNKINIVIDGDQGVKISHCVDLGKYLKNNLEDELEDFSFEVSSAGLLSPLVSQRQFLKNMNRKLSIQSLNGDEFTGNLYEVNNDNVKIEWISRESKLIGKGKVSVKKNKSLSYNEIKEAKLVIEF
jgi:ribosome maturation factor RimP|tara:strand:- start:5676 stop:6137 length:462 start_codon:yes stop_codon:yes gene_type:complete